MLQIFPGYNAEARYLQLKQGDGGNVELVVVNGTGGIVSKLITFAPGGDVFSHGGLHGSIPVDKKTSGHMNIQEV